MNKIIIQRCIGIYTICGLITSGTLCRDNGMVALEKYREHCKMFDTKNWRYDGTIMRCEEDSFTYGAKKKLFQCLLIGAPLWPVFVAHKLMLKSVAFEKNGSSSEP
jgi:hypothetical protein